MRGRSLLSILFLALLVTSLAGVMAQTGSDLPPSAPPRTPGAPVVPSQKEKGDQPEALPKIVRWVCTDRICGHCDGQCTRHRGHVAVSRRGHCACTPEPGSPLDQAIGKAFRDHEGRR